MAWPFKKKDLDLEEVPEEIQVYNEVEKKERASVAWMLAFGTLILTLIIATGAFYGGRLLYNRLKKNNQPNTVVQAPAETAPGAEESNPTEEAQPPETTPAQPATPSQPTSPAPTQTPPTTPQTPSPTPATPAPTQTAPARTAQPATGDSTGALPNTGPAHVISIFIATSIISGAGYHLIAKRR